MSMHTSAYSRGASAFGVLVLLGVLSVVGIAADEARIAALAKESQLALIPTIYCTTSNAATNSDCEIVNGKPAFRGIPTRSDSEEYKNLTCQTGNDFIIRINTDGSDGKIYYSDSNGVPTAHYKKSQCPDTETPEVSAGNPLRQCISNKNNNNRWKCYVKVCFRTTQSTAGKDGIGCGPFREDKPIEVGALVSGSGVAEKAIERSGTSAGMVSALGSAQSDLERAELKAQLDSGEAGASQGILGSYQTELADREQAYTQSETDYAARLKELDACKGRGASVDVPVRCQEEYASFTNAQIERDARKRELEAMSGYAQNLKGKEVVLTQKPQTSQQGDLAICPGGPGCKGGTWDPETQRLETFSNQNDPNKDSPNGARKIFVHREESNDPYNDFFGRNANKEDERACRYNNDQAACMRLARGGYGGYGAYGAAPGQGQQNRCGSQPNFGGGLGGIISGVISLFTKNNGGGNCTPDGVPKPQCTITASPTNIQSPGQQVTLSWQSDDAFSATLSSSGSVGVNGSQVMQPQQTTTYTLSLQGYRNTQTGQVLSGQCSTKVIVGASTTPSGTDPKAQISCSPQKADMGMSVAVSYSCLNSNTSSGSGFSTNNQLSGSATPVVTAPTLGSNSVTYGVTCSKDGKTDSAQCTVDVNKTSIVLIANPKIVESGEEANIGWVTSGMQSCTISSPELSGFTSDNAGGTNVSGVARTPSLTADATFVLTCTSRSGAIKTAETKVEVN